MAEFQFILHFIKYTNYTSITKIAGYLFIHRKNSYNGTLCCAFCGIISWGYPPQTRTQRTFREKSFGISKALPKQMGVCGAKFFGLPFSERKVSRWKILLHTFLIRKVCFKKGKALKSMHFLLCRALCLSRAWNIYRATK